MPFFIIGSPRSGTTLLRLMLTSHPSLIVPPECGFAVWLHPKFCEWTHREFADRERIAEFSNAVIACKKFDTWRLDAEAIAFAIMKAAPSSYGDACSAVYSLYGASTGKPNARWGDKNNFYLSHINTLRTIFDGARFIHIIRDGRDVACSYRQVMESESDSPYRPQLPTAIEDIAQRWSGDLKSIRDQLDEVSQNKKFVVRYEDLTREPERHLKLLCKWLGTSYSVEMLDFHRKNKELELEPKATIDWKTRTLCPVTPRTVERYKRMLKTSESSTFLEIAGAELKRYGYDQSDKV